MTNSSAQQVITLLEGVFPCSCDKGARRKHMSDCAHYWIDDLIGELNIRGYRFQLDLLLPPRSK